MSNCGCGCRCCEPKEEYVERHERAYIAHLKGYATRDEYLAERRHFAIRAIANRV